MEDILSMLYHFYAVPNIEDDELLNSFSTLLQNMDSSQHSLCIQTQRLYSRKAFQLGLRTGAGLERFLNET